MENGAFAHLKILWKMEHLLQVANAQFYIIFSKYMIFQRHQKAFSCSKGLMNGFKHVHLRVIFSFTHPFYRILTDWEPL